MGLSNRENITYSDKGFSVTLQDFNNLIYLDWSEIKWNPKNIEKYVLYVLKPADNKKNIFDGENPLIKQIVTEPRAMVKISNVNLRESLNGGNIGFFVGAIEKGKSEPSNKPSSWKQAKVKYTKSPNIWTKLVDGINLESCSACSIEEFLANYRSNLLLGKLQNFIKKNKVVMGFFGETPEKRMTQEEFAAKLEDYNVYTSGKTFSGNYSVLLLPKTMEKLIDDLKSQYEILSRSQSDDNRHFPRDFSIDISKYKFLKNSEYLKALKKNLSLKQLKSIDFNLIEFVFWKQIKFYKPSFCSMLQISWDYGKDNWIRVECHESNTPRIIYEGNGETMCLDKYFDGFIYVVTGQQWSAVFTNRGEYGSIDLEPYPIDVNLGVPMVYLE